MAARRWWLPLPRIVTGLVRGRRKTGPTKPGDERYSCVRLVSGEGAGSEAGQSLHGSLRGGTRGHGGMSSSIWVNVPSHRAVSREMKHQTRGLTRAHYQRSSSPEMVKHPRAPTARVASISAALYAQRLWRSASARSRVLCAGFRQAPRSGAICVRERQTGRDGEGERERDEGGEEKKDESRGITVTTSA